MADCWGDGLKPELSQGDLLSLILVGTAVVPHTALARGPTKKGGGENWIPSPWKPSEGNGIGYFLARGRNADVIVLSEDCEIDKDGGTAPVLVAPVFPLSLIQDQSRRDDVLNGKRYPFLPLPAIDGVIEHSYADLRCINYVDRKAITQSDRKTSMTENGVHNLRLQIIAFFTHVPLDKIIVPS